MGSRQSDLAPRAEDSAAAPPAAPSRALVALAPIETRRDAPDRHRQAPFLAHLLATKGDHPQTRERRRAEPSEAIAAYVATAKLTNH